MDTYLDLMQGCLQTAVVLDASGKRQTDLPTLPKYTHPNGCPLLVVRPVSVQVLCMPLLERRGAPRPR
jgi:hypothetical protein